MPAGLFLLYYTTSGTSSEVFCFSVVRMFSVSGRPYPDQIIAYRMPLVDSFGFCCPVCLFDG